MTSADLAQLRKRCFRISTRSRQWDSILNEGFQSASINEVYGEFRQCTDLSIQCWTDCRQDAARPSFPTRWPSSLSCRKRRVARKVGLLSLTRKGLGVPIVSSRSLSVLAVSIHSAQLTVPHADSAQLTTRPPTRISSMSAPRIAKTNTISSVVWPSHSRPGNTVFSSSTAS